MQSMQREREQGAGVAGQVEGEGEEEGGAGGGGLAGQAARIGTYPGHRQAVHSQKHSSPTLAC